MVASEDVQYFQFVSEGNMFVFKPGSGFSGPSIKVEPGFEMSEVTQLTEPLSVCNVTETLSLESMEISQVSELSGNLSSMDNSVISPTPVKR